jgi:hypothetical protein
MDIDSPRSPSASVENCKRKRKEDEEEEDGNGVEDGAEMCVRLNIDQIQNIIKGHGGINHEDHVSVAGWFAGWRVTERPVEAQRKLGAVEQKAFFDRVHQNKFDVAGVNEFRYKPDNTIEREYWIWDIERSVEWVVMHVHFAGQWSNHPQERAKRMDIVTCVNLRHSVSSDQTKTETWFHKCEEIGAWREKYGIKVEGLPSPWKWKETDHCSSFSAYTISKIMQRGDGCPIVRTLRHPPRSSPSSGLTCLSGGRRLALILAISEYDNENCLPNAVRDGEALRDALEGVNAGWEVDLVKNATYQESRKSLYDFLLKCEGIKDAVLVAFVGHGIQRQQENLVYLILKDSKLPAGCTNDKNEIEKECISTVEISEMFFRSRSRSGFPPTVMVFDCCRSQEPVHVAGFSAAAKSSKHSATHLSESAVRGTSFSPEFPNLCVIYSTNARNPASDGAPGGNGPFMSVFQRLIRQPGIPAYHLVPRLNKELRESHQQLCVPVGTWDEDFFFGQKPPPAEPRPMDSGSATANKKPKKATDEDVSYLKIHV